MEARCQQLTLLGYVSFRHAEQIISVNVDIVAWSSVNLVGLFHVGIKDLLSNRHQRRVGNPSAVMTGLNFPFLVFSDFAHSLFICRL